MKKRVKLRVVLVLVGIAFLACSKDNSPPVNERKFGIFTVQDDGVTVLAKGAIRLEDGFIRIIDRIHFRECSGYIIKKHFGMIAGHRKDLPKSILIE